MRAHGGMNGFGPEITMSNAGCARISRRLGVRFGRGRAALRSLLIVLLSTIPEGFLQGGHQTATSLIVHLGQHAFSGGCGQPWRVVHHDAESRLQHGESRRVASL